MTKALGYTIGRGLMLAACGGLYLSVRWLYRRLTRRK